MLEEIKKILSDFTEVPADSITLKSQFKNDLGLNSLDVVNIVVAFEEAFNIEIADEDVRQIITIEDAIKYIKAHR